VEIKHERSPKSERGNEEDTPAEMVESDAQAIKEKTLYKNSYTRRLRRHMSKDKGENVETRTRRPSSVIQEKGNVRAQKGNTLKNHRAPNNQIENFEEGGERQKPSTKARGRTEKEERSQAREKKKKH